MEKIKRLLSVLLAVCLLLTGIPMTALAVEPEPASNTGLFLRWLEQNDQGQWDLVPTEDSEFFGNVIWPDSASLNLGDKWYAAAYYLNEDGTVDGPFRGEALSIEGNAAITPLKDVEDETIAGEDPDGLMLCIAPTEDADEGQTFTLTRNVPESPQTAQYGIGLPEDGFYSDNVRDKAHLLGGDDMAYDDGVDAKFYLIVDPTQATWMSNVEITENADKASLAEVSAGVYKITVPAPTQEFNLEVQWDMQDPDDANNRRHRVRSMRMHPQPYTGLVLRGLEYDPKYQLTDEQGQPVLDEEGKPVTGAWFMPEIDQNNPLDRTTSADVYLSFDGCYYVTVHYFDGETLSDPINVNDLNFTGNVAHPSLSELGERVYGENNANYLALFPRPDAQVDDRFTISWTMPAPPAGTYTCGGVMGLPGTGFYRENERSLENLLYTREDGFEYSAENNTFYFMLNEAILHPDEHTTRTISNVRLDPGARKADITKVGEAAWKITLKEPFEPFDYEIVVKCDISQTRDGQPDGGWTEERRIWCHPQRIIGEDIGRIELGGTEYTVWRTEAGDITYSVHVEGSPFETEVQLPEGVSFALPDNGDNTYKLTLNNANLDGRVFFPARSFTHGQTPDPKPTLAINVEGANTINAANAIGLEVAYADLVIRGPGTLTINTEANTPGQEGGQTLYAPGIQVTGWEAVDYTADLAIQGRVTVNVNTRVNHPNAKNYDHFAPCIGGMFQDGDINLIVSDSAKLNLNAHGGDMGIRGITNIVVNGTAQLTADVITEFDSLIVGSDGDSDSSHASLVLNGSKVRPQDWLPTLGGKKIEVKGYGEITINEQADDRGFSPSMYLDVDLLDQSADNGLFIGNHGKVTINNAHSVLVNTSLEIAQNAVLDMNDGFGIGIRMMDGSTATINGTVTIDNVDNEYDNFGVWLHKGSEMTLGSSSSVTTSVVMSSAHADLTNVGFLSEGTLNINGGTHSFKATGNGESYGFISQRNGVTNINDGEITAEGSTRALFTNSTHKHNYFNLDGSMHIVSQDAEDYGTELGFIDGILEGSSPVEYEFYLYRNNNASGGTPVFVKKAKISSASGTAPKAERATVTLQTGSNPSVGARADFTANVNAPINTEALVTVELPSGLSMVSGSITKDSIQQNGTAIAKMPVMGPTIVRFSTDTTAAGDFPVTIKVFKDASATEPIAQATCTLTVRGFDISAPSMVRTLSETVAVTGSAAPGATVTLKLEGQSGVYASTTVNRLGTFEIDTNLTNANPDPGETVTFDTYLTPAGGNETKQEKQLEVKYQPTLPELKPGDIDLSLVTVIHDRADQPVKNTTIFPVDTTTAKVIRKTYPVWPSERKINFIVNVNHPTWTVKLVKIILRYPGEEPTVVTTSHIVIEGHNQWETTEDCEFPTGENGVPKLFTSIWMEFVFVDPETGEEIPYETAPMIAVPIIDPSGFVYEGNEDCRVEGVTAELYYSENEPGDKTAAAGGTKFMDVAEGNPLTTDALGQFAWMVPEGWWQVRFSKDGYNEAHTDWLPVQPIQTGLKVEMTATDTAAELVNSIERSDDGKYITVTFSKPVNVDSVTAPTVTDQDENGDPIFDADSGTVIVSAGGKTIAGTFSPTNGDGTTATKFNFVPSDGTLSPYAISIQAKAGIETYNGGEVDVMTEPHKESGRADGPTKPAGPSGPSGDDSTEEPVTNPDGSTTVTETAEDGTVTATTTWPDGKEIVETTSPKGDKTLVVTNGSGDKLADISIPADPGAGKTFTDVSSAAWYAKDVDQLTAYGLINGTGEAKFSPDMALTRGMLLEILHNLSGEPAYGTDKNVFTDVKSSDWFAKAVTWGYAVGVTSGTGTATSAPNRNITREEMVAMLHRYAKIIGADSDKKTALSAFPDSGTVSSYAKADMEWAVAAGLISGRAEGGKSYLAPKANAKRSEAAAILVRFLDYLKD